MSLKGFNLLQDNTLPPDIWDKVYDWVNKVGRVVVVLVELVVVVSFGTRIIVDTEAKNLQEEVRQNQLRLDAFKDAEFRFRDYQQKFTTYKDTWNASSSYATLLGDIIKEIPGDFEELAISLRGTTATIAGKTSVSQVGALETTLKASPSFADVQVPTLETEGKNDPNARADFSMKLEIKPTLVQQRTKISQGES